MLKKDVQKKVKLFVGFNIKVIKKKLEKKKIVKIENVDSVLDDIIQLFQEFLVLSFQDR